MKDQRPAILGQIMAAMNKSMAGCDIIEAIEVTEAILALEKTQ